MYLPYPEISGCRTSSHEHGSKIMVHRYGRSQSTRVCTRPHTCTRLQDLGPEEPRPPSGHQSFLFQALSGSLGEFLEVQSASTPPTSFILFGLSNQPGAGPMNLVRGTQSLPRHSAMSGQPVLSNTVRLSHVFSIYTTRVSTLVARLFSNSVGISILYRAALS